jgi:hypothetical protein
VLVTISHALTTEQPFFETVLSAFVTGLRVNVP